METVEPYTHRGPDSRELYNELKTVLFDHIIPNPRYRVRHNTETSSFEYSTTEASNYVQSIHLEMQYVDMENNNLGVDQGGRAVRIYLQINRQDPTRDHINVSASGNRELFFNLRNRAFTRNKALLFKTFKFFVDENQVSGYIPSSLTQAQHHINAYVQWFIDDNLRQPNLEAFGMNRDPWAREFLNSELMQYMPAFDSIINHRPPDLHECGPYAQRYKDRLRDAAAAQD